MPTLIPENNHLSRYCGKQHLSDDDGRVLPTAFHLKEGETYLSVNWIEYFKGATLSEAISELQGIFARKLKRVGASAKFAVLNNGLTQIAVKNNTNQKEQIIAQHEPLEDDLSHAGYYGITQDNHRVIAEIMAECVEITYPARQ